MEVLVVCHLFLISQMIISVVFLYIQFLLVVGICPFHTDERCTWVPKHYSRPSPTEVRRDKIQQEIMPLVTDMIHHAYNSYMTYAFPLDELLPLSCSGRDAFGVLAVTLVDALDTLAITGQFYEFRKQARWVCENIHFDKDVQVSVFETNIRVVGGLLAAHFLKKEGVVLVDPMVHDYDGCLLRLATDLADRLLPAFNTKTGLPYGSINLRHGVPEGETEVTSTASCGSFFLELHLLSVLTEDSKYVKAAKRAVQYLYMQKSSLPPTEVV